MLKKDIYNFWKKLGLNQVEIDLILQKITGFNKNQLFLTEKIDEKFLEKIELFFSRIVSGEPLEYILEKAEFFSLDFFVDKRTLIPRNDTEIMVEKVLDEKCDILVDVWTGSSCIAISVLKNNKDIKKCFVIDLSKKALEVSKINILKYNLEKKIKQINWNLLEKFMLNTKYLENNWNINLKNIIFTANLPYIKNWDFWNIDKEIIEFEPDLALYWWEKTGFELYEKLIYQIFELESIYNIKNIILFIEIGFDQKEICENFLNKKDLKFEIFKDNSWIDRCVKIIF